MIRMGEDVAISGVVILPADAVEPRGAQDVGAGGGCLVACRGCEQSGEEGDIHISST